MENDVMRRRELGDNLRYSKENELAKRKRIEQEKLRDLENMKDAERALAEDMVSQIQRQKVLFPKY